MDSGLDVVFDETNFTFRYGTGVSGPAPETRYLEDIRASLRDPSSNGPEKLYVIAMDVHAQRDESTLQRSMLLYGIVAYHGGTVGDEPVRSQGHVHARSPHSNASPPEIFEIWRGQATIYMQERTEDDPGRCFAVSAGPGERVIVPPGWGHMVVNAGGDEPMVFGAICDRGYAGFEYESVRAHRGLAFYPVMNRNGRIAWERNGLYVRTADLVEKSPRRYEWLDAGISRNRAAPALYPHAVEDPDRFRFVPYSNEFAELWRDFEP